MPEDRETATHRALSSRERAMIANASADVYVSMASAWELSILQGLARVRLAAPLAQYDVPLIW